MLTKDDALLQVRSAKQKFSNVYGNWSSMDDGEESPPHITRHYQSQLLQSIGTFVPDALTTIERITGPTSSYSTQAHTFIEGFKPGEKQGADLLFGLLQLIEGHLESGVLIPYDNILEQKAALDAARSRSENTRWRMLAACLASYFGLVGVLLIVTWAGGPVYISKIGLHFTALISIALAWGSYFYPQRRNWLGGASVLAAVLTIPQFL